jgi:hypothetical protein
VKLTYSLLLLLTISLISTAVLVRHNSAAISDRGPVRMIRFVLSDDGLYPRQMKVDSGLLNIAVEDKTNRSAGLVIESVLGDQLAKVTQIDRAQGQLRGRVLLKLSAGRYVVSDASQPRHTAELIVNP